MPKDGSFKIGKPKDSFFNFMLSNNWIPSASKLFCHIQGCGYYYSEGGDSYQALGCHLAPPNKSVKYPSPNEFFNTFLNFHFKYKWFSYLKSGE
jgi:hypothetical protein